VAISCPVSKVTQLTAPGGYRFGISVYRLTTSGRERKEKPHNCVYILGPPNTDPALGDVSNNSVA